eukprot:1159854-Pelagomonas_calceolata.AAC.9
MSHVGLTVGIAALYSSGACPECGRGGTCAAEPGGQQSLIKDEGIETQRSRFWWTFAKLKECTA